MRANIDSEAALAHLRLADAIMPRVIARVGEFALRPDGEDPFRSLSRAIVYQQLSGRAAGTIYRRFLELFGRGHSFDPAVRRTSPAWDPLADEFPPPEAVLALGDDEMRAAGLSARRSLSLRDLAARFRLGGAQRRAFPRLGRRGDHRSPLWGPRHWPLDGRDVSHLPPWPPGRAPGQRYRDKQGHHAQLWARCNAQTCRRESPRRTMAPMGYRRLLVPMAERGHATPGWHRMGPR
ncbi:MAG: hypothetical protein HS107_12485 [Thermoflexaceae bacterium]|nr:hypothetical protein [Thermoflexaceae bacterium]